MQSTRGKRYSARTACPAKSRPRQNQASGMSQTQFQFMEGPGHLQIKIKPDLAEVIRVEGIPAPVRLLVHPRARNYRITVTDEQMVRLTMPLRGSRRRAIEFLQNQRLWVLRNLRKAAERPRHIRAKLREGALVLLRGQKVRVGIHASRQEREITLDSLRHPLTHAAKGMDLHHPVTNLLRQTAEEELPPRVFELAARHRIRVGKVTVRDQKTRWGSCSPNGNISLNWRLIQMPPDVSDYVILHELMHRRVMNHSPRFWKHVQAVCPQYREAEAWLREHKDRLL